MYDEFDVSDILQGEDGVLLVDMHLPEDDWLYGLLLSFGTSVQVIEPPRRSGTGYQNGEAEEVLYGFYNMTCCCHILSGKIQACSRTEGAYQTTRIGGWQNVVKYVRRKGFSAR